MFTNIYNDFMFLLQIMVFAVLSIIAIIVVPYIIRFIISRMFNLNRILGNGKINRKQDNINFDEFDDIQEVKEQEKINKQEMQYEYEVLERVYEKTLDRISSNKSESLDIGDIIEAQKEVEKAKKDLYNFKVLDSVKVTNENNPEGEYIVAIKENQKNFDVELFKNWAMQIFKCIKLGSEEELKIIEKLMTHQMYSKLLQQTKKLKEDGLEFITEDLIIKEVRFVDYAKTTYKEEIKILVEAKMKEYIRDITTKKVLRGSNKKFYDKKIVMTFLKRNLYENEGFMTNCPNCGAETIQIEFGKCKYCDTLIFPIRYNWTLIKFETI